MQKKTFRIYKNFPDSNAITLLTFFCLWYREIGVIESHAVVGLFKLMAGIGKFNTRDNFPSQSQTYVILY